VQVTPDPTAHHSLCEVLSEPVLVGKRAFSGVNVDHRHDQLSLACHRTAGIARSRHLVIAGESCQLDARVDAELREHVAEMAVHRVRRDEEALGNLAVGETVGDKPRDGDLGRRQRRPTLGFRFGGDDATSNAELA
jgi:hypothetical protein